MHRKYFESGEAMKVCGYICMQQLEGGLGRINIAKIQTQEDIASMHVKTSTPCPVMTHSRLYMHSLELAQT